MTAEVPTEGLELETNVEGAAVVLEPGVRGWFARHPFITYLLRRIGSFVLTLWAAITATFFFFRLIPGNPIGAWIQNLEANYDQNPTSSARVVNHYKEVFGLSGNLWDQYTHYMYQVFIGRDLGPSLLSYPRPATYVIAQALPWTMGLLIDAVIISWVLGVLLGAVVGWRQRGAFSEFMSYFAAVFTHIPYYFIALILLFFLAYKFTIFPESEPYATGLNISLTLPFIFSVLRHALLPAFSIVVVAAMGQILGMRTQMIMVLGEDYLTFAQAKGLRQGRIMVNYAMRNAFLPQVTALAISLGFIFSGNVLIEQIFAYPGVGHLLVQAIQTLDFNVMMGIIDLSIIGVLTGAFILDLCLPLLDPRIRPGQ